MRRELWKRFGLVVFAGAVLRPDSPDLGLRFLVSLLFLFYCLHGAGARWGFRLGLLWGVVAYGATLTWLWEIFRWPALGLWMLLGLFVGVFGAWFGVVTRAKGGGDLFSKPAAGAKGPSLWIGPLAAIVWTGIEYYRCEWFWLRFPWITPGTSFAPGVLTPFLGAYGMTFLMVLACAWGGLRRMGAWAPAMVVGLGVIWMGTDQPDRVVIPPGEELSVALVQSEAGFLGVYRELTDTIEGPVDAIVWPEYAIGYDIRKHEKDMGRVDGILREKGASLLVLGSRTDRDDGKWHNTAITIGRDGVLGTHYKNRPVHFFEDGEPGEVLAPFETPLGRLATPVCFDCDYTAVARRLVASGAELILAPSMDAERWTARQHEQHGMLFRHRAAETGRWIAVAATSGVTQIIDPSGNVIGRLPTMKDGVLVGQVARSNRLTMHTRFGWVLGPACTIVAGGVLLWTVGAWWCGSRSKTGGR